MSEPVLSFSKGKFTLSNLTMNQRKLMRVPPRLTDWSCAPGDSYETTSLRAAVHFRRFSCEKAQRIFERAFQTHYDFPVDRPLPEFLDPIQKAGVRFVLRRKRSYLAHAPGAGKTWEAVTASLLASGEGQTLFVVPPSLTLNWEREITTICHLMNVWPTIGIVPSSAKKEDMAWRADFIVCPDSMLTRPWVYERLKELKMKFIAVDEASRFKDPLADRSIAFFGGRMKDRVFSGLFQEARHVVFLDGSPVMNRPMELWAPTFALHPEAIDCMSQDDFGYRYCGPEITERGQYLFLRSSHEAELKQKLQADFMHVVLEDELDHPERLRSLIFMTEDPRTPEMKSWERKHLNAIDPDEMSEDESQGDMARYRKQLGLTKIDWSAQYITERVKEFNDSVLVFAWHRQVCQQLALKLGYGLVIGGTEESEREEMFRRFNSGKLKGIVLNIIAGGRGHNLQQASRVVFVEPSWTDELNKQCEKRASRRGSTRKRIPCDYIVVPNSFDERVMHSNFTKEKRVKRIIG
jgi:SNF2 family DNA or RNA helicase